MKDGVSITNHLQRMQRYVDHLNKEEVPLRKIQALLRTAESGLKGKAIESTPAATHFLAIGHEKGKKRKAPSKKWKEKSHDGSSSSG